MIDQQPTPVEVTVEERRMQNAQLRDELQRTAALLAAAQSQNQNQKGKVQT